MAGVQSVSHKYVVETAVPAVTAQAITNRSQADQVEKTPMYTVEMVEPVEPVEL